MSRGNRGRRCPSPPTGAALGGRLHSPSWQAAAKAREGLNAR
ncbi:hypothetical protein SANTM175S_07294 [Streptomyces antimycoticus]